MLSESFTRDWNSAFKHTWETIKSESIKQRVKSHLSWRDSSTPAFEKALQRVCNSTNSTASIKPDCVNSNFSSFFLLCASKVTLNIISVKLIYLLNKKKLLPVIFKLCLKETTAALQLFPRLKYEVVVLPKPDKYPEFPQEKSQGGTQLQTQTTWTCLHVSEGSRLLAASRALISPERGTPRYLRTLIPYMSPAVSTAQ